MRLLFTLLAAITFFYLYPAHSLPFCIVSAIMVYFTPLICATFFVGFCLVMAVVTGQIKGK